MKTLQRRLNPVLVTVLSGALATACPNASAVRLDVPSMDGLRNAALVSDQILAHQRGKFSGRGNVISFGVEMESIWRTDKGELLRAGAVLSVDNRGQGRRPEVRFVPVLTISEVPVAGAGAPLEAAGQRQMVSGGNGIGGVNGIAQSIQVAGDDNQINNDAVVTIARGPMPLQVEDRASSGESSVSMSSSSGASVQASAVGKVLSVAIDVPDVGRVVQQIRGGDGGGILQMAQAAGDRQGIDNRMNIRVNLDSVAPEARPSAMSDTLQLLRGLRPAGAY